MGKRKLLFSTLGTLDLILKDYVHRILNSKVIAHFFLGAVVAEIRIKPVQHALDILVTLEKHKY